MSSKRTIKRELHAKHKKSRMAKKGIEIT